MIVAKPKLPGVMLITPKALEDDRGFFLESWNAKAFAGAGLELDFVQCNHGRTARSVLRGPHGHLQNPKAKLVRVTSDDIFDIASSIRRQSEHFGQWVGYETSATNKQMLGVLPGVAHGFVMLSRSADFVYKCTRFYDHGDEHGIRWDDPAIDIDCQTGVITSRLSPKYAAAPRLRSCRGVSIEALIAGANCQLGFALQFSAPGGTTIIVSPEDNINITSPPAVYTTISAPSPDIVTNTAPNTAVDKADSDPETGHLINAPAPPTATPSPVSVYGKTKLANEILADQFGTPTHTFSLARTIWELANHTGIYCFTDADTAIKYDLAVASHEEALALALGLLKSAVTITLMRTINYPTPANRPAYGVRDKTKTWAVTGPAAHWRTELRRCLTAIKEARA